ncbi:hypothetical protein BDK92_4777 [Micromonospora pisi]|uniref:Uncharacterized protein n=1 Tax=Micromonospora pisi TaxID=589240 RepID=A0A495JP47_9ACTN|nr:hypothetical protein [Micromonospora pisi]RKR90405.1 hypothetical protein BDK92_4777 [Micromonospora pisi]
MLTDEDRESLVRVTAVLLRVANLRASFPSARVSDDRHGGNHGLGIICWDAAPGRVWVWQVVREENVDRSAILDEIHARMANVRLDPRAAGRTVEFGPRGLMTPAIEQGAFLFSPDTKVTVRSDQDGVELYRADEFDDLLPEALIDKSAAAVRAATLAAIHAERHLDSLIRSSAAG